MRIKFTYLLVLAVVWPVAASANENCQAATTSADVMRCVNQNHETVQTELNDLFKTLSIRKTGEALDGMQALQTLWIEYRDRECEAETRTLESEALKRLEGLKCKTRLTRERINALERTLDAETGSAVLGEPPSTQQPRWINALAQQYPEVYWHHGGISKGDLDCDDDAEFVIAGLQFDEGAALYKTVIAISENPATGKPSSTLIDLPAIDAEGEDEDQAARQCSGRMSFSFEMMSAPAAGGQEKTDAQDKQDKEEDPGESSGESDVPAPSVQEETCDRRVIVRRKTSDKKAACTPVTIMWDGQNYVIEQ